MARSTTEAMRRFWMVAVCVWALACDGSSSSARKPPPPKANPAEVARLDRAIAATPGELSLHEERLDLFLNARDFEGAVTALEDSLADYPGSDALDPFLARSERFMSARHFHAAIRYLHTLEEKYPRDHRIAANLGAFYGLLENNEAALKYATRAVELEPNDARNQWNLGRMHDYAGNVQKAEEHYQKSLALRDESIYAESQCLYARFLRDRRQQKEKACAVWKEHCAHELPAACR